MKCIIMIPRLSMDSVCYSFWNVNFVPDSTFPISMANPDLDFPKQINMLYSNPKVTKTIPVRYRVYS